MSARAERGSKKSNARSPARPREGYTGARSSGPGAGPAPVTLARDMQLRTTWFDSPIGRLRLAGLGDTLVGLGLGEDSGLDRELARLRPGARFEEAPELQAFAGPLTAYFAGELSALDAIPVDPAGEGFERRVWLALREIPAGETLSYGELARRLGEPDAARAVGTANGRNPIPIVLPCHRVIGADGSLVGYGGGLERKRWLLEHENAAAVRQRRLPLG
jgi:methylated-DNA-[protein]-cysteine S-methyltransferase